MKKFIQHVAVLMALVMVITSVPRVTLSASQVHHLTGSEVNIEFHLLSSWSTGYTAQIVIRNISGQEITNWALNLNRPMSVSSISSGRVTHQDASETAILF